MTKPKTTRRKTPKSKNTVRDPDKQKTKPNAAKAKTTRRRPAKSKKTAPKAGKAGAGAPAPRKTKPSPETALRQVADWIIAGNNDFQIDEATMGVFGISKIEATKLRRLAFSFIAQLIEADPHLRKSWHVAARQELYRRALQIHDYKTARDILRDLGQLEGLYPRAETKPKPAGDDDQAENQFPEFPQQGEFPTVQ